MLEGGGQVLRTEAELSAGERETLRKESLNTSLPEGCFFNGTTFIDFTGAVLPAHPAMPQLVQAFLRDEHRGGPPPPTSLPHRRPCALPAPLLHLRAPCTLRPPRRAATRSCSVDGVGAGSGRGVQQAGGGAAGGGGGGGGAVRGGGSAVAAAGRAVGVAAVSSSACETARCTKTECACRQQRQRRERERVGQSVPRDYPAWSLCLSQWLF